MFVFRIVVVFSINICVQLFHVTCRYKTLT